MVEKKLKIGLKWYYYFDEYGTREQALFHAKRWKKERKLHYYILPVERGLIIPEEIFLLYLNKQVKVIP